MARQFYINGESMILVKGASNTAIGTLSQLGLTSDPIQVSVEYRTLEIQVDAYGRVPPEAQSMGMVARIQMNLVHFDVSVLNACIQATNANAPAVGALGHAGTLMGGGVARFQPGNNYIGLNIQSAIGTQPWRFYYAYLANNPLQWPLGAERSIVPLTWYAVPYSVDPWNNGQGSYGVVLWDNTLDT